MTRLRVCTWNAGNGGSWFDFKALLEEFPIVGVNEGADRQSWIDRARDLGRLHWYGSGTNGRAATPLFWDPAVTGPHVEKVCEPLTPRTRRCPGTGPDTVKAKWLIGVGWDFPGIETRLRVGVMHAASGQSQPCRGDLARRQFRGAAAMWPGAAGPAIIVGDMNTRWNDDSLDPFRHKGWRAAQGRAGGPHATHGDWTPDQQWYRNARPTASGVRRNGSDHHAYWVEYDVG